MAFDFDEKTGRNEEYDAVEGEPTGEDPNKPVPVRPLPPIPAPPVTGSAADIVAAMFMENGAEEQAAQISDDEYMNEVEKRLEVAANYRLLLQDAFFSNDTEASRLVTTELRTWVRERLAELVGMSVPKKPGLSDEERELLQTLAQFTPAHLQALKMVADRLITGGAVKPSPVRAQTPAPALVKRGSAPSSAQSEPQPTVQPHRRPGPGRPPGSKNRPKLTETKGAVDADGNPILNDQGEQIKITNKRVQKPAGALPFPNDMSMVTHQLATAQAEREAHKNQIPIVAALVTPSSEQ